MIILSILFFITAILYSSVGFGGGSTYLALLLIWDIPYYIFPVIALLCNIIVVTGNSINYVRAGNHNFKLLIPFLIGSIPLAFIGGTLKIEKDLFEIILFIITEDAVLKQLKKLKKNRSPGVDGFTVEHLISVFLGGNRNVQLRDGLLQDYVLFLKKFVAGQLTQHQLKLFHAVKLSAIPKDDLESRVIMMFGAHSKLVFSIFASSKMKKNIED